MISAFQKTASSRSPSRSSLLAPSTRFGIVPLWYRIEPQEVSWLRERQSIRRHTTDLQERRHRAAHRVPQGVLTSVSCLSPEGALRVLTRCEKRPLPASITADRLGARHNPRVACFDQAENPGWTCARLCERCTALNTLNHCELASGLTSAPRRAQG